MDKEHSYSLQMEWTGNTGQGTSTYQAYERGFTASSNGKQPLFGSSDPMFRGDAAKWNPEELLLTAISSCHMLEYLHLAAVAGIVVTAYRDDPKAILSVEAGGRGFISKAILNPVLNISDPAQTEKANSLHHKAHEMCFIANSTKIPIEINPASA